jgi:TonB family protein
MLTGPSVRLLPALAALLPLALVAPARGQEHIREEVKRPDPKLTKPPVLLKFVPATYPPDARSQGISGTVELDIEIGKTGDVTKAVVLKAPDPRLGKAAEAAARKFRFSPAEVDGQPAPVRLRYSYKFVLELSFNPRLPSWMEEREAVAPGSDVLVGRVREEGTRLPLAGVAVAVRALGIEVKTDSRGAFGMRDVPPGKHRVEVISLEHRREGVEAEVRQGEQTRIDFYLRRTTENPYETVVRGERRKTVVSRVTLRQKELTTVPGTFGDPLRVVENLPGVARVPYVGGALLIRGASPSDSGVFLDGTLIPALYHFLGGPSVLNPEFLDRIDYYPGNADVRYGRLIAGVVDVATRNTFTQQWGGSLDVNLLNTSLFLKVPLTKRVSVAGAVRRSYIDAILPGILKLTDRKATTVVPVYYDYQLRTDVDLRGDDNHLFVLLFGSDDQLAVATNEPKDKVNISLDSHVTFHRLLSQWRWQATDRLLSKLTPTIGINQVKFSFGGADIDLFTLNFLLREDLEWRVRKRVNLRFGLDTEVRRDWFDTVVPVPLDYRNPGMGFSTGAGNASPLTTDVHPVTVFQTVFGLGLYADSIVDLTDRFQLIPGLRAEAYRYSGNLELSLDPRITARFALRRSTTLKAAVGLYSEPPQPNQVNDTFGNPNLGLEHAAHFSAGVEHRFLPFLALDAQVYGIWRYGIVVPTDAIRRQEDGSLRLLRFNNDGEAYSYGLELILKHDVTRRFYGWLAYTLSRTMQRTRAGGDLVPFVFDQTHLLTLVASVRLGANWEVGARFRLVSGRPDTPILDSVYDSDQERYRRINGASRSTRLPLFHQLDLRVEKTWIFKLWRFSAYLDVQNIYNAENPEAILYDYRFRDSGPLRGLPLLPSVGIKGSF